MLRKTYSGLNTILLLITLILIVVCMQPSQDSITYAFSESKITLPRSAQHTDQNRGANIVTFNLVPSVGLRSIYKVNYIATIEIKYSASPKEEAIDHVRKESMESNAKLETKVLSSKADGTWALSFAITTLKVKIDDELVEKSRPDLDEPFSITMDKKGKLLNIPENLMTDESYRHLFIERNPMLMLPIILLPSNPIRVGDSWQFDISNTLPTNREPNPVLRLKGTGILKSVDKNRAFLDLDFTAEFKFADIPDMWTAKATASVIYDLDKARFLMNKISVTKQVVGFSQSETERGITLTETLELESVK